jgi:diguanylate cyclase (GGDEF)-like protein
MLGLDDFEQISDRYGPATGASALKIFAGGLNKVIRGCDLAVLAGRGDIMVVLPECSVEQAQSVVNRLPAVKIEVDGKIIPLVLTESSTNYKQNETSEELFYRARRALDTKRQSRTNHQSIA